MDLVKTVHDASQWRMVHPDSTWCVLMVRGASWWCMMHPDSVWCILVAPPSRCPLWCSPCITTTTCPLPDLVCPHHDLTNDTLPQYVILTTATVAHPIQAPLALYVVFGTVYYLICNNIDVILECDTNMAWLWPDLPDFCLTFAWLFFWLYLDLTFLWLKPDF